MKQWLKDRPLLLGLVGGIAGVLLSLLVWQASVDYRMMKQDHAVLQTVVQFLNQQGSKK